MMDDYSLIIERESEIAQLRNELTTAYMVGYRDGSALHHYIPFEVTQELLRVLDHGEIKHPDQWKTKLPHVHIKHGGAHLWEFSAHGRAREEESGCYHLAHAIVRYMFALAQYMGAVKPQFIDARIALAEDMKNEEFKKEYEALRDSEKAVSTNGESVESNE
ncbi:MAG: dATP/dGTP diphosphohydrolase domain-containing protein [Dehalococcoidia bacterium]|jgi:hypothetical protein